LLFKLHKCNVSCISVNQAFDPSISKSDKTAYRLEFIYLQNVFLFGDICNTFWS